ncbi:ankyrin repeat domain-containing protein [Endozoicomonas sp. ONNA2]|uniref:ankyrin repeat domain-containing protein n=1 Tax=Endozoicomonas sp. ONNA2 TaxID=2828741 RepID=UPI002149713C|nr:ankyrin repeat domain-containing protein [Endozoicomonas sp. ONNA2]
MNGHINNQISPNSHSVSVNDLCSVELSGPPPEEECRLAGIPVRNNLESCVSHFLPSPGGCEYRSVGERDVKNNSFKTRVKCGEEQLIKAVSSGDYEKVVRCLAEGVSPNCQANNISILALAVKYHMFDIVHVLLDNGASPDVLVHDESIPCFLEKAYLNRHYDIAQKLIDNGCPIDKELLFMFFEYVVIRRYFTGIEFCLKNGIDVNREFLNCSPIVNLLFYSVNTLRSEECSFEHSLRVMAKYGADLENVVWMGRKYSLLSCYLEIRRGANIFYKNGNYNYRWLRALLLMGCRVSDEVVQNVRNIDDRGVLDSIARHLNVPGDIVVLTHELLKQAILRTMEVISGTGGRGGSLKDLSLGIIARNISHNKKPGKAIESLPLPEILKKKLKEYVHQEAVRE